MNELIDIFYKEIIDEINAYETSIIQKEFVNKVGPLDPVQINIAKGEVEALKQVEKRISTIYKKYKTDLTTLSK